MKIHHQSNPVSMATTKLKLKKEDPSKPTPQQLQAANQFAKTWALRNNLISGENTHVGGAIPPFVDSRTGQDITGVTALPAGTITDIRQIPSYVTADNIIQGKDGFHYFEDQNGDMKPIHPDILRTPRFNPNRGKSLEMLIAKK